MNGEGSRSPLIGLLFYADDDAAPDGYHQGEVLAEINDGMFLVADIGWGGCASGDHFMYYGLRWVLYVVPLSLMRGFHFSRPGPDEGESEPVTFPPEVFEITRNPLVIEAKEYHLNEKPLRGFVKVGEFEPAVWTHYTEEAVERERVSRAERKAQLAELERMVDPNWAEKKAEPVPFDPSKYMNPPKEETSRG